MSQKWINEVKQQSILQREKDVKASRVEDGHAPTGYFRGMSNAGPPYDPRKLQTGRLDLWKMLSIKKMQAK